MWPVRVALATIQQSPDPVTYSVQITSSSSAQTCGRSLELFWRYQHKRLWHSVLGKLPEENNSCVWSQVISGLFNETLVPSTVHWSAVPLNLTLISFLKSYHVKRSFRLGRHFAIRTHLNRMRTGLQPALQNERTSLSSSCQLVFRLCHTSAISNKTPFTHAKSCFCRKAMFVHTCRYSHFRNKNQAGEMAVSTGYFMSL